MVTTRRNGGSTAIPPSSDVEINNIIGNGIKKAPQSSSNALMAILPTSLEAIALSIPAVLLELGSLFSIFDPAARAAPYNPTTQSHPPDRAPAYFALKSNFLNKYFVKVAWAWVTAAYVLFLFFHRLNGPVEKGLPVLTPKRLRGLVRYSLVTAWWFLVTQWCFGPALIDRGFRITGGACELAANYEGTGGEREFVTSQACKKFGGVWRGGHDISGHVFILVLASSSLMMELLPAIARRNGLREERQIITKAGEIADLHEESDEEDDSGGRLGMIAPSVVVGLSWFMLLVTAAYFHTWFEKVGAS